MKYHAFYKIVMGVVIILSFTLTSWPQNTEATRAFIINYNETINFNPVTPEILDQFIAEESFKQELLFVLTAFPEAGHPPLDIIVEDEYVAVRATFQGVHKGEFAGIPPTNKAIQMRMIAIYHVVDNKIVDHWVKADELGMMEQLGVFPPDPTRQGYDWSAASSVEGDPGDPESNKALVRQAIEEIWNQNKTDKIEEYVSPDYLFHIAPADVSGIESLRGLIHAFRTGIPDIHFQIENMIAENDKVVVPITYTGTHLGELFGMPATGNPLLFTGTCIYRIADGKIVEEWNCTDSLGLMGQLQPTSQVPVWDNYQ